MTTHIPDELAMDIENANLGAILSRSEFMVLFGTCRRSVVIREPWDDEKRQAVKALQLGEEV